MAGLSASGLGSGLDIKALVSQLMSVEQQPLVALQKKEASYQAKISALGSLKSSLSSLQTAAKGLIPSSDSTATNKFTTTRATFGDTSLGSATATNSAAVGRYTLSEISLANAQQIRKSGMSIPSGSGTLSITLGSGTAVDVDIAAGSTLANIRDAINASSAQVSASIINDGTNDFLMLTSDNSGASNTITVSGSTGFEDFNYSSGTANSWVESVEATNASVKVNGITVTSDKNTISTAIEGVTLTLAKETTGSTTLNITQDHSSVTSGLNAFITAFNDAAALTKSLGAYNSTTKTASTLTGDSTLRSVDSQLRTLLFSASGSDGSKLQRLSDIGVNLQLDGTLKLDSSKLTTAINNNFDDVANLVANIGTKFNNALTGMVDTSGSVSNRIEGMKSSVKLLDKRQEELQLRLEKVEANYNERFNALDVQLSSMQSLSTQLTSLLASIPSASSS